MPADSAFLSGLVAGLAGPAHVADMRCYYVLVHGTLRWSEGPGAGDEPIRPEGFMCHRYVLASDEKKAAERAFARVRENLDAQTGWLRDGLASVYLEAEEVVPAPIRRLLKRDNRGHTFYGGD